MVAWELDLVNLQRPVVYIFQLAGQGGEDTVELAGFCVGWALAAVALEIQLVVLEEEVNST